jgi:cytochrome c peroxidase
MRVFSFVIGFCFFVACINRNADKEASFRSLVPAHIKDRVYEDPGNSFSSAKIELGRYLFYDTRLSVNQTKSCASCHAPSFSFTDQYKRSVGAYGDVTAHNAPALINLVLNRYLTNADSSLHFPEQQIRNPLFHTQPVELGWEGHEVEILSRLRKDTLYAKRFRKLFPKEDEAISTQTVIYALASFVKSIVSFNSPFDRFLATGDSSLLATEVKMGYRLFLSDSLACFRCHGGGNFNRPSGSAAPFFNTGFFPDTLLHKGLMQHTGNPSDAGRYRVPTLRNLAFTAPYLHDGSAESLEQVVRMYEKGGNAVVAAKHPFIKGFRLNSQQRSALLHFLLSLSDSSVLTHPSYSNPFQEP